MYDGIDAVGVDEQVLIKDVSNCTGIIESYRISWKDFLFISGGLLPK